MLEKIKEEKDFYYILYTLILYFYNFQAAYNENSLQLEYQNRIQSEYKNKNINASFLPVLCHPNLKFTWTITLNDSDMNIYRYLACTGTVTDILCTVFHGIWQKKKNKSGYFCQNSI